MIHRIVAVLLLGLTSSVTSAADVHKWVDEDGRIHYGDSAPDRYKGKSKKIDLRGVEPGNAHREEAKARLARERAGIRPIATDEEKKSAVIPNPQPPAASSPAVPGRTKSSQEKCQEELRKYFESDACFAPYRLANGGIKPEAYDYCTEMKQPQC